MLAFPSMLEEAAKQAGIKVPEDSDNFEAKEFPHFAVFCNAQLGRSMQPGEHWENAKIIAAIPDSEITSIDVEGLIARGFAC